MFHQNDTVRVKREISRFPEGNWDPISFRLYSLLPSVYAREGETGTVLETFQSWTHTWHAKVLINGKIKTFRLTSLEKLP